MKLSPTIISLLDGLEYVILAVSGGSDSMLMCFLVREYWLAHSKDPSKLIIAHYNHKIRSDSHQDKYIILQSYPDLTFEYDEYLGGAESERDLRAARHQFFVEVMNKYSTLYLITGHNLTDRIETSLLNMKRGSQIRGLLNMSEHDTHYIWIHNQQTTYHYLRPLLDYSKHQIQDYCDQADIDYITDETNLDITVSQRNKMRHEIVMKLNEQDLNNRRQLYDRLNKSQTYYTDPVWDDQMQGWCVGKVGEWDLEYLLYLFNWSACYDDMTQGRLLERQKWIAESFTGEKFVVGWRWWIKQKYVYISQDLL